MDSHIQKYLNRVKALKSEATYKKRRTDLRQFNEWAEQQGCEVIEMDSLEIEGYFLRLRQEGYAPNSISGKYSSIFNFYDTLAGKFDIRESNPIADLKRSDYVERNTRKYDETDVCYVTPQEKEHLAEHVSAPKLRNELMIRLLWQTGIREGELVEIKLDDVNRGRRCVNIWAPKTKESRTVFYQPSLDFLMNQWLDGGYRSSKTYADESEYVFITRQSAQFRPENVNNMVKDAAENAGIQEIMYKDQAGQKRRRITSHALRHGHAVHALKSGIDVRTVQKHMGHSSLEMTMRYLQLIDEDVKEGYQRFGVEA